MTEVFLGDNNFFFPGQNLDTFHLFKAQKTNKQKKKKNKQKIVLMEKTHNCPQISVLSVFHDNRKLIFNKAEGWPN